MKAPNFWHQQDTFCKRSKSTILRPLGSLIYRLGQYYKKRGPGYHNLMPVICVGNLTVGGNGKTPVCIFLGRRLQEAGWQVHYLTRGYKGKLQGPIRVDRTQHTSKDTGDEALLLDAFAPTIIAKNRVKGAKTIACSGAHLAIMDDGLQNHPSLHQDFCIIVIDRQMGFGNGQLFPAGPLREPITTGLHKADAIIVIGDDKYPLPPELEQYDKPIFTAQRTPVTHGVDFHNAAVIAFAGIGYPEQFFASLQSMRVRLIQKHVFADHHRYSPSLIRRLIRNAELAQALLVTTEKDMLRIPQEYHDHITPFVVELKMAQTDEEALAQLLFDKLSTRIQQAADGYGDRQRAII